MIRRGRPGSDKKVTLYQCVIFYGKKASEELGITNKKFLKELGDARFTYPYYSKEIFYSDKDALRFIPMFVKQLIEKGLLDKSVIVNDKLDLSVAEAAIVPLQPSTLEDFDG